MFGNIGVRAVSSHQRGQMKYLKELGFLVWHTFYIEKI